jgi:hypothetical protein
MTPSERQHKDSRRQKIVLHNLLIKVSGNIGHPRRLHDVQRRPTAARRQSIRKASANGLGDSTQGLEGASHHAVIPNVNTIDKLREVWPRLSSDEKKLFDVQSSGTARSEACTAETRSPAKKCACNLRVQ